LHHRLSQGDEGKKAQHILSYQMTMCLFSQYYVSIHYNVNSIADNAFTQPGK